MEVISLCQYLENRDYPGRGIVIGSSPNGRFAVCAYFIMGRSSNSRNRIFTESEGGIQTQAFDESKLEDPSLIIYHPVRVLEDRGLTIVTNGDQTDTIRDGILKGLTFEQALSTRTYEPDPPIYTPRISGIIHVNQGSFNYGLNILKSRGQTGGAADRFTFVYEKPVSGQGHIIHTYMPAQGDQIPSFQGEPVMVLMEDDIDEFTNHIWDSLNNDNKVSLFVRYIDTSTGGSLTRIVNKNFTQE